MGDYIFTDEAMDVFLYLNKTLLSEHPTNIITAEHFISSMLETTSSVGYKILTKIMLSDTFEETKEHFFEIVKSKNDWGFENNRKMDADFENALRQCKSNWCNGKRAYPIPMNSGIILYYVMLELPDINQYFKKHGVTTSQVYTQLNDMIDEIFTVADESVKNSGMYSKTTPVKHTKKQKAKDTVDEIDVIKTSASEKLSSPLSECEKLFTNLNNKAKNGSLDKICGNDKLYDNIFNVLSKRNKNNVAIVGKSGVGKSDIVRNIANLIVSKKVPKNFNDKILLEIDMKNLFSGTTIRGMFEARTKNLINEAKQRGNYIFFLDSLDNALNSKYNDTDIEDFINSIITEKNIMFICTCSEKGYTKEISDYPAWNRSFEKVAVKEPDEEECIEILKHHAEKLEYFHNVKYDENIFRPLIKLSKRYITDRNLPESAIDIIDKAGAKKSNTDIENDNIRIAREKLNEVIKKRDELKIFSKKRDYAKIDALEKEEIELRSILDFALKNYNLEKQPFVITENDIRECVAEKANMPLQNLSTDDKEKLKGINDRIKSIVIGQDEAVDDVCRAIKRQRMGISNPNKPVVFLMAGSTGVGKSYLAKTIAKEVFGDEKKLVRLDMAEYADKTSITKLIGAGSGYIGYDNGGLLTEAVKKNKHCVLLLDEIEKAYEEVHNTFLSLFDEGRLTDNKGVTVDFKNCIVIMTSNVGAKEIEERGNGIGFVTNNEEVKKDIISKELKRKFKPEFINRIDKIVYFNKLNDDDMKRIISLELDKLKERIKDIGYNFETDGSDIVDVIFDKVKEHTKMGARPILRAIQSEIEDKITDYLIDNDIEQGNSFNYNDIRG